MTTRNFGNLRFFSHVSIEDYNNTYRRLKTKYAKALIDNWPECTDPLKFVHEDLGIASFLLLLWKDQGSCKFVDLGCGNGLLVYILTQEGHIGRGLDVRRRKVWDLYPKTTALEVETIVPSEKSVYPEADWLIGNHSDELTAWLPIMASRSSPTCQFFTIPCCPYKLNGAKYQRRNAQLSVYQDFLEYVEEVGKLCGFEVSADKMRIPSTKRICLVGRKPLMSSSQLQQIDEVITKFIHSEFPENDQSNDTNWIGRFKARDAVEPVINCTKVPKDVQNAIIDSIKSKLLTTSVLTTLPDGRLWNQGGSLTIAEAAAVVDPALLDRLRSEARGLQTLLKNHHQVFEVKLGRVSLRSVESLQEKSKSVLARKSIKKNMKPCWFAEKHPDGCPLMTETCSYYHNT